MCVFLIKNKRTTLYQLNARDVCSNLLRIFLHKKWTVARLFRAIPHTLWSFSSFKFSAKSKISSQLNLCAAISRNNCRNCLRERNHVAILELNHDHSIMLVVNTTLDTIGV